MSRWSLRRERFREILGAQHCVYPASVYDPISARIAEHIGYEMGMYAGSLAALAVLALMLFAAALAGMGLGFLLGG